MGVTMPSALTWVASSHGPPPTTSSCALATVPNMPPTDTSFVDLLLFPLPLPVATAVKTAKSSSPPGRKRTSEPEERDGGTKQWTPWRRLSVRYGHGCRGPERHSRKHTR